MQWIPTQQPTWSEPHHLEPLIEILRRIVAGEKVRIVVATPPRHGKTETLLHWIVHTLKYHHPDWRFGYASYAEDIAYSKSSQALDLAKMQPDIELSKKSLGQWTTKQRGGMLTRGIGGGMTGMGFNVGIVDDPVKDRLQAESPVFRERTKSWFRDVFFTRLEPNGSVIINMARWHPEDLAGFCITELGWPYLNLPAINRTKNTSLWPSRWPLDDMLERERVLGEYGFASLYQGNPIPRGGKLFGSPYGFEPGALPIKGRYAIGLDMSYAARTSSDWSAAVVMKEHGGYFYVVEVHRLQVRAPEFFERVKYLRRKYFDCNVRWYASGTEIGVSDMAGKAGMPIIALPAIADKFVRAQPYAAAWNDNKILLKEGEDWLNVYVTEHTNFTGLPGGTDDQVDAAVAAYDELVRGVRFPKDDREREGLKRRM